MTTVLTIEDDAPIRQGIVDALHFHRMEVIEAYDFKSGLQFALDRAYDLMLLDLVLPGGSGLEVLRSVRRVRPTTPIIILSAKGDENDRVVGLREGADDYVVKPFGVKELIARIEAVLRRSPARPIDLQTLKLADVSVDLQNATLKFDNGSQEALTEREVYLLRYLANHSNRIVPREELLRNVWQIDPKNMQTRVIDVTISRLREKLATGQSTSASLLQTVHGKGYRLNGVS